MRLGVLGTGTVGQTLASAFVRVGHEVMIGSRQAGNPKAVEWAAGAGEGASEGSFADAGAFGETVVNATAGVASLDALAQADARNLVGKVLIDVANPLDFTQGMPPRLAFCNDTSLAERIQDTFPEAKVVKALNTVNAAVMVDPGQLADHGNLFICGNDDEAKAAVVGLLGELGWLAEDILDLGDVSAARGQEMYLALWLRLWSVVGEPAFNVRVVR